MSCELHGKAMWLKHEARGAWLLSLVLELCWISLDTLPYIWCGRGALTHLLPCLTFLLALKYNLRPGLATGALLPSCSMPNPLSSGGPVVDHRPFCLTPHPFTPSPVSIPRHVEPLPDAHPQPRQQLRQGKASVLSSRQSSSPPRPSYQVRKISAADLPEGALREVQGLITLEDMGSAPTVDPSNGNEGGAGTSSQKQCRKQASMK